MSHLYRVLLTAVVFLLLVACTTYASTPLPTTSPASSPTPAATIARAAVAPSPTPTAVPVTASPAPTPKPTVLRVAYSGGGHIMLWTEGKGSHPLGDVGNAEDVRISDDGQVIAYIGQNSSGIYGIWAINADGTHQRLLAGQDYVQNIQPAGGISSFDFAPGSHAIYFVTDQYDLHRVTADSGAPTPLFGPGQGGFFSFSPDSQWMTLYHPRELVLAPSDGSAARVVYKWSPDIGAGTTGPEVIWAPDSAGFRMVMPAGSQGGSNSMTVWYFPVKGNPVKQMSYTGPYGADLSPDGRTVAYLYYQHAPVDVHIVTMDGTDTIYDSYTNVNISFMGWAPDSKHFLLNLSKDGRLQVPYLCAVGEQPVKLTDTDDAHAVVWVETQRVLFVRRGVTLHLQRVGEPSTLLDANASSWFDFTFVNP